MPIFKVKFLSLNQQPGELIRADKQSADQTADILRRAGLDNVRVEERATVWERVHDEVKELFR